jgi:CO/xanthine dehydrogenase Mo-binding subunit
MTEMLNKEFSRKSFFKGGALLVGLGSAGSLVGSGTAEAAIDPYQTVVRDSSQVDSYITVHADNTVSITPGGSDFGQGSGTAWVQLAAEELDMDVNQVRFVMPDTGRTMHPQQSTSSSFGTKGIGPQVRTAAAYARQELVRLASVSLGVPVASLTVKSGVVSGGGKSVTYGQLMGGKLFNVKMPVVGIWSGSGIGPPLADGTPRPSGPNMMGPYHKQGDPPTKKVSEYKIVGTRVPRIDIPDMVTGKFVYSANVRVPGMVHGRVVLPRGQGAYGSGAKPLSVDESSIKHVSGAQLVRRGDFVGVVADDEYAAVQAAAQLKVTWADPPRMADSGNFWKQMREHDAAGKAPAREGSIGAQYGAKYGPVGNVEGALKAAARTLSQTYTYAYQTHAPIGPQVAVADVKPNGALIITFAQGVSGTPAEIAGELGLPTSRVRVKEHAGSSYYGGGAGNENPSLAAAVMSQIVGKPVRVMKMRWDEHGWDTFGAAHLVDMRGGVDANGNIVAYEYTSYASQYTSDGILGEQLGGSYPALGLGPLETSANGVQYELPNWRVLWKTLPLYNGYFKTAFMRASHSAQTNWATEIFADELAYAAKMDPVAFRRQNVRRTQLNGSVQANAVPVTWSFKDRFLAVLDAVATASKWEPRVAASRLSDDTVVSGRGVSFGPRAWPATFSALVAEIEVNRKTGKILVKHLYAAQDSGLGVNPAGLENQITGQVVMNTSRALLEQVTFNGKRVTSQDWVSYPILRIKDSPKVTPIVIQRPEIPMAGGGDHVMSHVPTAIANAFFDATGVRIRDCPMTPARVRAALAAAGRRA